MSDGSSASNVVNRLALGLREIAGAFTDPLEATLAASQFCEAWALPNVQDGRDLEAAIGVPVVRRIEELGGPQSLAMLRALEVAATATIGTAAKAGAQRMSDAGIADPAWYPAARDAQATAAVVLRDDVFGDGETILVEFSAPEAEPFTFGVVIDQNLGGIAHELMVGPPIAEHRGRLDGRLLEPEIAGVQIDDLPLPDARERILAALQRTGRSLQPPVGEEYETLHAVVGRRVATLPTGERETGTVRALTGQERAALVDAFLDSPEMEVLRVTATRGAGANQRTIVAAAVDFATDDAGGDALRWSPTVVERFMLDWLPRKVALPEGVHDQIAPVLVAWVRFAGRGRLPVEAIERTVAAVAAADGPMRAALPDESYWGPAKAIAMAGLTPDRAPSSPGDRSASSSADGTSGPGHRRRGNGTEGS